jgi:1,4-alpha-glucan branching enzyme
VGIGVISGSLINRDGRQPIEQVSPVVVENPQLPDSLASRTIKFVLVAPEAGRVSLIGDFNQWNPAATPLTRGEQKGTWTAFVALRPGMHTYSFVLDGNHFVADPAAPMAADDGYGHKSSVVIVRPAT